MKETTAYKDNNGKLHDTKLKALEGDVWRALDRVRKSIKEGDYPKYLQEVSELNLAFFEYLKATNSEIPF